MGISVKKYYKLKINETERKEIVIMESLKEALDFVGNGIIAWSGVSIYKFDIQEPIVGGYFNLKRGVICPAVGVVGGIVCKKIATML